MIKLGRYFCFLFIFLSIFSCKNEILEGAEANLKLGFAPLEVGKYWVYQNDSITYVMGGATVDTTRSYSREVIAEKYLDESSGDSIYRIERFFKDSLQNPWILSDVWTCQRNNSQYIRTEENLKFIKLIFPPNPGTTWDGNKYFDEDVNIIVLGDEIMPYRYWDYTIEEPDTTSFGGTEYTEVIKVNHIYSVDPYEYRESFEHYAEGVGMVQRRMIVLDAQCEPCPGSGWTDWAEKGFILEQLLIESN